ncbi:MAG: RagB/SusD family nutrient uptake outer membrane protein, partial [Dysgonamonadaceae bacterium]|nr:RagB/SusD family nutrient uptake outer membrane protein [Dysgonamonadaceae bacterium]
MKKILFILLGCIILVSCDDFLNTESLTQKDSTNFPTSPNEANQLLTNCYTPLSGIYPLQLSFYMSEIMSDNCLGGGDAKDSDAKLLNTFSSGGKINRFSQLWTLLYTAIYRCNTIILSQDMVEWETGQAGLAQKNFILGQAHFLRAYYYFELAKTFENVPLQLTNEVTNPPQAAPDKTYAQIASDLKTAIEMLPGVAYTAVERGRVTRWAAEGYMARIFLFYTGYYGKENMPLNDGSSISKQQVLDWLEDCITNSGHDLVPDFRSLWPYSYQNPDFPDNTIYQYVQDNNIPAWVGDGNIESVFAAQKTSLDPGWSGLDSKTNQLCVYYGLRMPPNSDGYFQATFPFGRGWGQATVNSNLWEQWPDNDLRKRGSILHIKPYDPNGPVDDPVEGIWMDLFTFGADGQTEETGFWNKKYMPVNAGNRDRGMFENYSHQLYNNVIQDF